MNEAADVLWESNLAHAGLGGIAANNQFVVFGDRDLDDFHDVFRCLNAATGETQWEVQRLAINALDYGNTPRATPTIHNGLVYCQGAHGHLLCIRLTDGQVLWEKNFRDDFPISDELPWGYCGSPLVVENRLIVAPGAADASLVALDLQTGDLIWKTAGKLPSYGSFTAGTLGGVQQIVGHDADSLGGWDSQTGKRLWSVVPENPGDFNVPTPIIDNGQLIVTTENNGTRRFQFDPNGIINPIPIETNRKLHPDMSTPVIVGGRLFCVKDFLFCLDVQDGLNESWRLRDRSIGDYAAIIASDDRILVIGKGELLLYDASGGGQLLARQKVFEQSTNVYSHPALVGDRLFIRGETKLKCIRL